MIFYDTIPKDLRESGRWIRANGKAAIQTYKTDENKAAHMKSFAEALKSKRPKENLARLIDKADGFVFVDLDKVRNAETGEIQPWAAKLIEELDTYTEISGSGTGFHLVARGILPEDYQEDYPDPERPGQNRGVPVELKSGNVQNRLFTLTGNVFEIYTTIENRQEKLDQLLGRAKAGEFGKPAQAQVDAIAWRKEFRDPNTLETGDIPMLIKGILPEGVSLFGSPSGVGKTWMAISALKALTTGEPYLGVFEVPEIRNCIYLIPEVGDRSLRYRLERLHVPLNPERFLVRTLRDGTMRLSDPALLKCVEELKPVVFLDTAIRFATAKDENSAAENSTLADALFNLIRLGAPGVIGLHHSPKSTANSDDLSLENVLRGTGDLGAMCDAVWGLQHDRGGKGDGEEYLEESKDLTRIFVKCVKPRDFEAVEPFRIQGRPYIDERGDFVVLTEGVAPRDERLAVKLVEMVARNPKISQSALGKATGVSRNRVAEILSPLGWIWEASSRTSGEWKYSGILNGGENPF